METPLVSVVIPTYNRALLLQRTLASVVTQDYRPIEVIVVDDGSDDDTDAIVAGTRLSFAEVGIPLRLETLAENSGPAAARNVGLGVASGSFIGFLDSDDLWTPPFVSTMVELMGRYPTCGLGFCGTIFIGADDTVIRIHESGLPETPGEGRLEAPFNRLLREVPFMTQSVLVRRAVFDTVGVFDEQQLLGSDWDMWYRIAKQFDFAYTLTPLVRHRSHSGNITKNTMRRLAYSLRLFLCHLDDVEDPATRHLLVARIRREQTLLQEQFLREGQRGDEYGALLSNNLTPDSIRFRLGRLVMHAPPWVGRSYAGAVRAAGDAGRGFDHLRGRTGDAGRLPIGHTASAIPPNDEVS